jgi:hypothetical protein
MADPITNVNEIEVIGALTAGKLCKILVGSVYADATNTDAEVAAAVTASHARSHAITSSSDHTSSATSGKMLKADANGLHHQGTPPRGGACFG